jgi:acyl carrier protein
VTPSEIRALALRVLGEIAPEADLTRIAGDVDLREQLEIDSMDFLNFVIGLHEATGADIPEADYGKLATLDACAAYLADRPPGRSL